MSREDPQMKIRLPADLKDRIEAASKQASRSMNAEIVVRLEGSFEAGVGAKAQAFQSGLEVASLRIEIERLKHERMQFFQSPPAADTVGKLLDTLPAELVSQYGLHLYRTELDRVEQRLKDARQQFQPLYEQLQALLSSEAPQGARQIKSQAVSELQKRMGELEEQAHVLKQTLSAIHTYRQVNGLPAINNVQMLLAGVQAKRQETADLQDQPPPHV